MNTKIRRLREMCGYTQDEVSRYLEISQPLYSQVENGNRPLRDVYLEPLALLYGLTLQELLEDPLKMLEDKTFSRIYKKQDFAEYTVNGVYVSLKVNKSTNGDDFI